MTKEQPRKVPRNILSEIQLKTLIEPKSINQSKYLESIYKNIFTFGVGLAGTGKSLLAAWAAMQTILNPKSKIDKIVVIRPVIGNKFGESIGALPGTVLEKMMPYGSSIIDNLSCFLDKISINKLIENEYIEFIPLTLLRGRSLNNSFIIVEEAQNIKESCKGIYMIMSRLGANSKMVINGDLAQSDIGKEDSALASAIDILGTPPLKGVGIVKLYHKDDIQRNPILFHIMERFGEVDVDLF